MEPRLVQAVVEENEQYSRTYEPVGLEGEWEHRVKNREGQVFTDPAREASALLDFLGHPVGSTATFTVVVDSDTFVVTLKVEAAIQL